jgi:hypothetical protein
MLDLILLIYLGDPLRLDAKGRPLAEAAALRGLVCPRQELTRMPSLKTVAATLLAAGVLLTAAALAQGTLAQGTGRWTTGTPMPSARTEIAVAEVGGKIYVVGGFRGERELEIYDPSTDRWSRGVGQRG